MSTIHRHFSNEYRKLHQSIGIEIMLLERQFDDMFIYLFALGPGSPASSQSESYNPKPEFSSAVQGSNPIIKKLLASIILMPLMHPWALCQAVILACTLYRQKRMLGDVLGQQPTQPSFRSMKASQHVGNSLISTSLISACPMTIAYFYLPLIASDMNKFPIQSKSF